MSLPGDKRARYVVRELLNIHHVVDSETGDIKGIYRHYGHAKRRADKLNGKTPILPTMPIKLSDGI